MISRKGAKKAKLRTDPAASYEDALARIQTVQAQEEARGDVNPVCCTQLLTHGERAAKAILFFHGFTSCPAQFATLGRTFFERGYNVYIPRTPHHGMANLMSEELARLTAEKLIEFGLETVDVAQGLGEKVTVCGLSAGGTLAGWLAQRRGDIDLAVLIAPFLGIGFLPAWLNRPLTNLTLALPDRWQWWDPIYKQDNPETAPYGYRRYPTHAMAEVLRLGLATLRAARRNKPATSRIVVITSANDTSVHNGLTVSLANAWRKQGAVVTSYEFEKSLGLPHDIVAPERPNSNVGVVYPVLLRLMNSEP